MPPLRIHTLQAFSAVANGGNGAGVVLNAPDLLAAEYTAIAQAVGFSETAFVLPSKRADVRVRFFTPAGEVDFCGHATVATFALLFQQGILKPGTYTQETLAGVLNVRILPDGYIWMDQQQPSYGPILPPEPIAQSLGMAASQLLAHAPVQIVSTGLPDILVGVKDRETLWTLEPDFEAIRQLSVEHQVTGYHVFCLEPIAAYSTAHCRNFAPRYSIDEEPATGSASGALACYLHHYGLLAAPMSASISAPIAAPGDPVAAVTLQLEQGWTLYSPAYIQVCLQLNPSAPKEILGVQVGGYATQTGCIEYPTETTTPAPGQ
ncbi:MAG: PhzF family phenazine biosynthesis protein [Candidatus Melainabacteria bacterium]|nr:PhzF family phenazine biosynthesis protein [Candidatus Melainabacteria bacterium]